MRSKILIILAISVVALAFSACGGGGANTPNANVANANANATNANTTDPTATTKAAADPTTNNGPTLTPVFKAYCDAWVKGDDAALRKVYSSDTIKIFDAQIKEEKAKNLLKLLEDDKVSGTPCEVRNEVITGDTAVARIVADKYPNGIPVVFVKENGEWKLTNKSPAIDSVTSATNSNTAK
ncbi:MAG: nuclear transport factor 2 family protein [Acidobacteriota bacterium]